MAQKNKPNILQQLFEGYIEITIETSIKDQLEARIKEVELKIKNTQKELDEKVSKFN